MKTNNNSIYILSYNKKQCSESNPDLRIANENGKSKSDIIVCFDGSLDRSSNAAIKSYPPEYTCQIFGALTFAAVHISLGAIIGFTGITLPAIVKEFSLDPQQISFFSSSYALGSMIGVGLTSALLVWFGQKTVVFAFLPIGIISWILLAVANSNSMLIAARILQGVVYGILFPCSHTYVVEVVHTSVRGKLTSTVDLFRNLGILFISLVGSTDLSWRVVSYICGITSMIIPLIGVLFLPHSPRWLALKGRNEESLRSLTFYRGTKYNVEGEMKEITDDVAKNVAGSKVIDQIKMMKHKNIRKRVIVLLILSILTQFGGNVISVIYSVSIFQLAEVTTFSPYLGVLLATVLRTVGLGLYLLISDRFGRKPLVITFTFMSGLCMFILGVYFYLKSVMDDVSFIFWIPIVSLIFYHCFVTISFSNLVALRSEVLPTSVRAFGAGMLQLFFAISSYSVIALFPFMLESLGSHWTFWTFALINMLMVAIIILFIPETRGKTLEEIGKST